MIITAQKATAGPDEEPPSSFVPETSPLTRRTVLRWTGISGASTLVVELSSPTWQHSRTSHAIVQAVGSGETRCREAGNCLEMGELDGAVGWYWGGKDRCDPADALCGADGKLRSNPLVGQPVPELPTGAAVTHVADIQVEIGRGEIGILRLGFYGTEAPGGVQEIFDFIALPGLQTKQLDATTIGSTTSPVSLARGGIVSSITPNTVVEFGVPSQQYAYTRSRGLSKLEGFVPQSRPNPALVASDVKLIRSHNQAGLISIPVNGLGQGGFESDDETFNQAFLITAGSVPVLDKKRRVVGQILDGESMAFLERLASLPTKKGIKGVIPGQNAGPPLLKVTVRKTEVTKVIGTQPSLSS